MKKERFKNIFLAPLAIIFTSFFISLFVFAPVSFKNLALALTGDYSKDGTTNNQLDYNDWNNLVDDFLDKESTAGDSMAGPLTLPGDPTSPNHAATKSYVDGLASGGDMFTNWGRSDCPAGTQEMYDGFAFGKRWSEPKGSGQILCVAPGMAGPPNSSAIRDKVWPVGTGVAEYTPPSIDTSSEIPCAVCYASESTCYKAIGTNSCNTAQGFNVQYTGYIMGGVTGLDNPSNENNNNRECVNENFDGSTPNGTFDSVYAGTVIVGNADLPSYTTDSYIRCALCCN